MRRLLPLAATSGGLLAWSNLVVPRLPPAPPVRVAANLGATAVLLLTARSAGLTAAELGWNRGSRGAGLRWGSAALALSTAGYLAALAVPAGRRVLARSAPAEQTPGALAVRALVAIPLGTVLCEEIAFRGVLLALANRRLPVRAAHALTAVVFGLWHIAGARSDTPGTSVPGTVVVTALGGAALASLRTRSGSLLAPVGLHLGTNVVGLLAAAGAHSQSRKTSRARSVSASVHSGGGAMIAQASTRWAP
jgi:membrane protease YdiL (CAAX protease family)